MSERPYIVIGGAGFIGSHLVDRFLVDTASPVVVVDDFSTGRRVNLRDARAATWCRGEAPSRLRIVEGDASRDETWDRVLDVCPEAVNPCAIFHLAAVASIARAEQAPERANAAGAGTLRALLRFLGARSQNIPAPPIVFASSVAVYGRQVDTAPIAVNIDDPLADHSHDRAHLDGIGVYAADKQVCERMLSTYNGPKAVRRLCNVFGERARAGVIAETCRRLTDGEAPLIHVNEHGCSAERDFVHVSQVVSALMRAPGSAHDPYVQLVGSGVTRTAESVIHLLQRDACAYFANVLDYDRGYVCAPAKRVHVEARVFGVKRVELARGTKTVPERVSADVWEREERAFRIALRETLAWHVAKLRGLR